MDLEVGMGIDPLEHIREIGIQINALQTARSNQTLNNPHVLCPTSVQQNRHATLLQNWECHQ